MNRRNFLGGLLKGVLTAAVAPQVVTHGLKLKFSRQGDLWVPNPEYEYAQYEVKFLAGDVFGICIGPPPWLPKDAEQILRSLEYVAEPRVTYCVDRNVVQVIAQSKNAITQ